MATKDDVRSQLDAEVNRLKEAASRSTDACLVAKVIAASDTAVQELFIAKVTDRNIFKGASCLSGGGSPNETLVLFDFDCPPGTICLIKPSFLVVVDVAAKEVRRIVDPYEGTPSLRETQSTGALPFPLSIPSNAPNVITSFESLEPFKARESAFFQARLRAEESRSSYGTPYDTARSTPTAKTTYCPNADDTTTEYITDIHPDANIDWITDD